MARQLTLVRTEAEWLVDLLEDCDPAKIGTWRHLMAAEVRELFGMCSLEEERRRVATEPVGEPVITLSMPEMFEQKPSLWVNIVPAEPPDTN